MGKQEKKMVSINITT